MQRITNDCGRKKQVEVNPCAISVIQCTQTNADVANNWRALDLLKTYLCEKDRWICKREKFIHDAFTGQTLEFSVNSNYVLNIEDPTDIDVFWNGVLIAPTSSGIDRDYSIDIDGNKVTIDFAEMKENCRIILMIPICKEKTAQQCSC